MNIEKIFTEKFEKNSWLGSESRSGPGSSLLKNIKLLSLLEKFVKETNVRSIIDIGCGDFNWMKHFNFGLIDRYVGIDIVKPLIEQNQKYSNNKIEFKCVNIIDDCIECFDLILCKDVLFHLSYKDALSAIENIKKSKSTFFVSTTFYDFVNKDITTGAWRPINLEAEPFLIKYPIYLWKNIENKKEGWISKSIGIWRL